MQALEARTLQLGDRISAMPSGELSAELLPHDAKQLELVKAERNQKVGLCRRLSAQKKQLHSLHNRLMGQTSRPNFSASEEPPHLSEDDSDSSFEMDEAS